MAPVVVQGPIVPLGWTYGLGSWADLTVEMTPYYSGRVACITPASCRQSVFGLVATAGVSFGRPIVSVSGLELGWMVSPKVLVAVADEIAVPGADSLLFSPGVASEIGGGLDFGLELHGQRLGLYAAFVLGVSLSAGFGVGGRPDFGPTPPSWPAVVMALTTGPPRQDVMWVPGINLNLLRVGMVF
ncbi:MAG TPA: hypothetical protein VIG99_31950 [Myxococcaceae bacterium]